MSKKITTGVEKAYYAILEADGVTPRYDTVKYLQGLREFSITANEEQASIYAENRLWESENSLGEIEVTLDFASIFTEDYAALLGKKLAGNGGIIESVNDQPPYIALMLEKTLSGGVKEFLTLFKGKLSIPEDKGKTKEGATEYQTSSLSGIFMALENGIWKHVVRTSDVGFNETEHTKSWGKSVVIPTEAKATPIAIAASTPADNATGVQIASNITVTFNNPIVDYSVSLFKNDFTKVDSTISIDATNKIITIDPKANLAASTKYAVIISSAKDIYGQVLEETVIDFTTGVQ